MCLHCRSDATLNRNGVPIGSSDIHYAVQTVSDVTEPLSVKVHHCVIRPDAIIGIDAVPQADRQEAEIPVKRLLLGQRRADVVDLGAVERPDVLAKMADPAAARSPS
jgi:hypothetical protein